MLGAVSEGPRPTRRLEAASALWNTGDSEMRHYAPYCHNVEECGTLAQLERFVSRLLRSVT